VGRSIRSRFVPYAPGDPGPKLMSGSLIFEQVRDGVSPESGQVAGTRLGRDIIRPAAAALRFG